MNFNSVLLILIASFFCSCSQPKADVVQHDKDTNHILGSKTGLLVEYGLNQGIRANSSQGMTTPVIYTTSTITNTSDDPIHIKLALSKIYEFPTFCGDDDHTYKVVLLPAELTPDTATLRNTIVSGKEDFFKNCMDNPYNLNRTLNPGEYCVITIGTIYPLNSNCEVIPRALFSHDNIGEYLTCDRQENQAISAQPQLEIGVKLEYYYKRKFIAPEDGCAVIPCGQFSYTNK